MATEILTGRSHILREMRPLQRQVSQAIVSDVLNDNPPSSRREAIDRYKTQLGAAVFFDDGKGWTGDLREAAIICLIHYGFKKAKVVHFDEETDTLSNWSKSKDKLQNAAALEYEFGSNARRAKMLDELLDQCSVLGEGREAVYVDTDSLLDTLDIPYTKIGKHLSSELGSVASRVLDQYGTANPGRPVLRNVFKTADSSALETLLHRAFQEHRVKDGIGTEWFLVAHHAVENEFLSHVAMEENR